MTLGERRASLARDRVIIRTMQRMADIERRATVDDSVSNEEIKYFNTHLNTIKEYFQEAHRYWKDITPLKKL